MGKAWREMIHRYFAKLLGLLVIAIAVVAWRKREELRQSPALPIALVNLHMLGAAALVVALTLFVGRLRARGLAPAPEVAPDALRAAGTAPA